MIKDLFINMTILISFVSLGSQVEKNFNLHTDNSLKGQLIKGVILGVLGNLLMLFSVELNANAIIDFRNIAIIISAVFGGTVSVFITAVFISVFRIAYFGANLASFLGVSSAIMNAVGCWYIANTKIKTWNKWSVSTVYVLVISTTALFITQKDDEGFLILISAYWISNFIVSAITYWYVLYNVEANKHFSRLEEDSTKDFLTGLSNVRQFDITLNSAVKTATYNDKAISLLMLDIDFFKKVNDTYGHIEGDLVLKGLARILSENCRYSDEIFRNGGEEFSVLLPDCSHSCAVEVAENIRESVENIPIQLSTGKEINITVSIGVASFPQTVSDVNKLMEKADTALYKAKRTGRNKVCD